MSPESKSNHFEGEQRRLNSRKSSLHLRAEMIQAIRRFFVKNGYLEVDTPMIIPAPPPEIHIDAVHTEAGYLHTSPELCMKRLLAAGYAKIFQIAKCFRANERGNHHLPEFCMLEWYRAGIDYHDLMAECEELVRWIAHLLGKGEDLTFQNGRIDLHGPWKKITVREAFARYASISLDEAMEKDCFEETMVMEIEPGLISSGPVFLHDYPSSMAALARLKASEPDVAERFELFMGGLELANGFSELTDISEQRTRFENEARLRISLGKRSYPMPEKFLNSLPLMPDAAGVALGVDRLAMLFANKTCIEDVVAFTPEEL